MTTCIELGCGRPIPEPGYCLEHQAQFWPLWAEHPLDEPCPPGCPSRDAEIASHINGWLGESGHNSVVTADDVAHVRMKPALDRGWIEQQIADLDQSWR
jgi:hypothetical protein